MRSILLITLSFVALFGCGNNDDTTGTESIEKIETTVWLHSGQESERQAMVAFVEQYNSLNPQAPVELTVIPEGSYNSQIQAAALAGDLPDMFEVDGPFLYNYVWQNKVAELDDLVSKPTLTSLIPSILDQGTYNGKIYGLGMYDSGLGLYVRKSVLAQAGIRIPTTPADAWSDKEFSEILEKLSDNGSAVLDLKLNYSGEWFTYAFYAALNSGGGGLVNRDDYQSSGGVLDSDASKRVLSSIQKWISAGYVDANVDDAAFTSGRVPLSWVGHWAYPAYKAAWGDDLAVVPLPSFGEKTLTGQGSWQWVVNKDAANKKQAAKFLAYLLSAEQALIMSNANGAVPANKAAIEQSKLYGQQGDLHLFAQQLTQGYAIPRPKTPAYPLITSEFQSLFAELRAGGDINTLVEKNAAAIDEDIADNMGYKLP